MMLPVQVSERNQRGFTLIELAMVVAIITILMGIVISSYPAVRHKIDDRRAQKSLLTVQAAGRALTSWGNGTPGTFPDVAAVDIDGVVLWDEPGYTIDGGASTGVDHVSVFNVDGGGGIQMLYAVLSPSGTCWALLDTLNIGVRYGEFTGVTCEADLLDPGQVNKPQF